MDKKRFAFDRLHPFEGSSDRSKLINYCDQPEEAKERSEKYVNRRRSLYHRPQQQETNSGHLGGGIIGESELNASVYSK